MFKEQNIGVFYVDYGNFETLPIDKIRKLDNKYVELPGQAIPGSLAHAFPANNSNRWSDAAILRFRNLIINAQLIVKAFHESTWPIHFCNLRKQDQVNFLIFIFHIFYVKNKFILRTFLTY